MLIMASFLCKNRYFNPGTFKSLKYKVFFTINMFIAFKYKDIQKLDKSALSLLGYLNQQAVILFDQFYFENPSLVENTATQLLCWVLTTTWMSEDSF